MLIGACMSAAVTVTGCGVQENPLSSSEPLSKPNTPAGEVQTKGPKGPVPVTHTQRISAADGGVIKLSGKGYEYKMTFPPGALDEDTDININVPDVDAAHIQIEFSPHGLQFNVPVELKFEVQHALVIGDIDDESLDVYYFNEDTGELEAQNSSIKFFGKHVQSKSYLNHFSQYSLGGYGPIQKWYYQGWYP